MLPERGGNGQADGAPDVPEHAQHGQHNGDVLVRSGGHDGDLVANDDGAGRDGNKDLAHDDVADGAVRSAEVDHEAQPQDAQGNTEVEADGSVAARGADEQARGEGRQDGAHGVRLDDVAGVGDAQVVHHLQEGAEVAGPAVVADVQRRGEDASAEDRTTDLLGIKDRDTRAYGEALRTMAVQKGVRSY